MKTKDKDNYKTYSRGEKRAPGSVMVLSAQGDNNFKEKPVVQWNKRGGNVRAIPYPARLSACVKNV